MADLVQNASPKHNPFTTIFGVILLTISAFLFVGPYFLTLKEPIAWWTPIIPLGLGLLLLFMNDDLFAKLFNRADKIAAKKTGTD